MGKKKAESMLEKAFGEKQKKEKMPMFSEEQRLVYGIHPDDKMYRKTMELDILRKD